jgi:PPE-repeat protein
MSAIICVQLDAVESLAEELRVLAAELADEEQLCRSAAASLAAALDGDVGWDAAAAATAWGRLAGVLAAHSSSVATTLSGAVEAYRAADAMLAEGLDLGEHGSAVVPR